MIAIHKSIEKAGIVSFMLFDPQLAIIYPQQVQLLTCLLYFQFCILQKTAAEFLFHPQANNLFDNFDLSILFKNMLKLKALDAKFNKDSDTFSKMDPYVKMNLDGREVQTKTHEKGGVNPVWDEEFEFNAKDLGEMNLKVQVYDNDPLSDDFLGAAEINIKKWLQFDSSINNQVITLSCKGQETGIIRIQYFYNPDIIPSHKENQGFIL